MADREDIPNGEDVVGTGNDARLKFMEQINDANDEAARKEGAFADINDDGTTENALPSDATDQEITDRELKRAEEESGAADETPAEKIKLKVNGKEEEVTLEELIERAQKGEGAEEKFKEAARLRAEAEELRKQNSAPQPSQEDVAANALEERRALVRAIQMGTEDEAMAAIEKLQKTNTPSVSPDDVARTIDERLTFNDAVNRFKSEYKDIVSDPVLLDLVLDRDRKLLAKGDKRGYWDRYESIGKEVRAWMQDKTKATTPAPTPDKDKQQRKASAPAVPKGASTKAPEAAQDEDPELTPSEIISQMAKARGGAQFMR